MTRALALVDGEHYPPVTLDAIGSLRARGFDVVAAVMLGGTEKLAGALVLGDLPVVTGVDAARALVEAIDRYRPEAVVDVSDAPVLATRARLLLASTTLARGVAYVGADFRFDPPPRPRLTSIPTIAVIGTGKRTGKTAVCAALARRVVARGLRPVIVAMGRGGPAVPVVTRGDLKPPTVEDLLALAARGEHAATDAYEDAVVARCITVGARRAGAGLAGAPLHDTVPAAVEVAASFEPDVLLLEGSGTAIPPAAADATLLVVGGTVPAAEVLAGLGPLRMLISDLAVVTMAEEPVLSSETLSDLTSSLSELARDVPIVRTVFRPGPLHAISGRKILFATTAPAAVGPALRRHLEEVHGAIVVGMTHALGNRPRLSEDLAKAEGSYEVLLTEIKAAAIDVAARAARAAGADVVFADNLPVAPEGALDRAFDRLVETARARAPR